MALNYTTECYKDTMYSLLAEKGDSNLVYHSKLTDQEWVAVYDSYSRFGNDHSDAIKTYNNICKRFSNTGELEQLKGSIAKYSEDIMIMFPELYMSLNKFIQLNPTLMVTSKTNASKNYLSTVLLVLAILTLITSIFGVIL